MHPVVAPEQLELLQGAVQDEGAQDEPPAHPDTQTPAEQYLPCVWHVDPFNWHPVVAPEQLELLQAGGGGGSPPQLPTLLPQANEHVQVEVQLDDPP